MARRPRSTCWRIPSALCLQPGDEILLSMLEHHSNLVPWQRLAERRGVVLRFLPMTPDGRLDLDRLDMRAHRALPAGRAHALLERHRRADRRRPSGGRGPRGRSEGHARRRAARAARAARPAQARRRFLCLFRPQDLWADRHWRAVGPARAPRRDAAVHDRRTDDRGGDADRMRPSGRRRDASRPGRRRSPPRSGSAPRSIGCRRSIGAPFRRTSCA